MAAKPKTKPKSKAPAETSDILTLAEAAAYLKVSEAVLLREAELGRIPARQLGDEWRFSKSSIDAWMKSSIPVGPAKTVGELKKRLEHFWATRTSPAETEEEVEAFLKKIYDARKEQLV